MKKILILILMLSCFSQISKADSLSGSDITNADQFWKYRQADYFSWNEDNGLHILAGYTISFTTAFALERYTDLSPLEAGLIGFAFSTLLGTVKEVFIDSYCSKTDIKTWSGGAALGTLTFVVLQF
jgi:hypothetical protein